MTTHSLAFEGYDAGPRRLPESQHIRPPDKGYQGCGQRPGADERSPHGRGGEGHLEHLTIEDSSIGCTETIPADALLVLIGDEPCTERLPEEIARDERGFAITGQDLLRDGRVIDSRSTQRLPAPLETSMPGMFTVGVRHRSVKRVASPSGKASPPFSRSTNT